MPKDGLGRGRAADIAHADEQYAHFPPALPHAVAAPRKTGSLRAQIIASGCRCAGAGLRCGPVTAFLRITRLLLGTLGILRIGEQLIAALGDPRAVRNLWRRGHGLVTARGRIPHVVVVIGVVVRLSLIHISEPTRQAEISYAVFCL